MRLKQTHIDFGPSVKGWSYERFMSTFRPIYPDADLEQYATDLGLVPVATEEEAPATDTEKPDKPKRGRGK